MNKLYCLFGPSGAGKTTLGNYLKTQGYTEAVSVTSRPMRAGEVDGETYYYHTKDEIFAMDLAEYVEYPSANGTNIYGLTVAEIERCLALDTPAFTIVERRGLEQLKEKFGDRVEGIYITYRPEDLIQRLRDRGDTQENIRVRLEHAMEDGEFEMEDLADHIIINTHLETSQQEILGITGAYQTT